MGRFFLLCALLSATRLSGFQNGFDELSRRVIALVDTNPEQAVEECRKAVALRPDWAEGWLYMGASLFKLSRFKEARDAFRKGVALEPQKGTGWAFLGMAEYELGDYQEGLPDILKGENIGLADNLTFIAAVHYRAALIFLNQSDFSHTLEQLRPLVSAGNNSETVVDALGLCVLNIPSTPSKLPAPRRRLVHAAGQAAWAYEAGRLQEATRLFATLTVQFPNSPWVHYLNGVNLIHDDPERAAKEFRRELEISPENALAHGQLALLLMKTGDSAEAMEQARQAVQHRPSDPWCLTTLGRVLLSAGQLNESITDLETSRKMAPNAALTHFYLAEAYRRAGKINEAREEHAEWTRLRAKQESTNVLTR